MSDLNENTPPIDLEELRSRIDSLDKTLVEVLELVGHEDGLRRSRRVAPPRAPCVGTRGQEPNRKSLSCTMVPCGP